MGLRRLVILYVQDGVSPAHQKVRNQHAMTTKIKQLRAHDGGIGFPGVFQQTVNGVAKFVGEHVIGVVAKGRIAQRDVGRLVCWHLPASASAKIFFPEVIAPNLWKPQLQVLAIEMGMASRHGKSANVFQQADVMLLQYPGEVCKVARGMSNSEDRSHRSILFGYTKGFTTETRRRGELASGNTESTDQTGTLVLAICVHAVIYNC
jgi:hypothetical protein